MCVCVCERAVGKKFFSLVDLAEQPLLPSKLKNEEIMWSARGVKVFRPSIMCAKIEKGEETVLSHAN